MGVIFVKCFFMYLLIKSCNFSFSVCWCGRLYWFSKAELALHIWDKSQFVAVYNSVNTLLNSRWNSVSVWNWILHQRTGTSLWSACCTFLRKGGFWKNGRRTPCQAQIGYHPATFWNLRRDFFWCSDREGLSGKWMSRLSLRWERSRIWLMWFLIFVFPPSPE